ncbi:hypothetical protein H6F74_13250 [Trichocoleus sp. FACHB-90]|uniref:hypothetical protein n=1 Tax=Cyanophyceae TaxID=3028117 RepID=UPI001686A307|nr:hypothetical protein [Trichocoleus sp. FACHB-90]MBD1927205.1 hypothetical protein [Trichocoleus sp. FACHB-90]
MFVSSSTLTQMLTDGRLLFGCNTLHLSQILVKKSASVQGVPGSSKEAIASV